MNDAPDHESKREQRLNDVFVQWLRLTEHERRVKTEELVRQYPDLADDLKELWEVSELIEWMAGPAQATADSDPVAAEGDNVAACHDEPESDTNAADASESTADTLPYISLYTTDRVSVAAGIPQDVSFGDYHDLQLIGQGGMGVVCRARQISLNRTVALKMIRSGVLASERDVERFYTEAQAAGQLRHPNIVKVYHVGDEDGQLFYTMEYVEGTDLAKLIRQEKLDSVRIARYIKEVAEGIHHAHEHHLVHRDLKPANILIDRHDRPLVTDFGLCKNVSQDQGLTSTGASLGTPTYMSPEQAAGKLDDVGPASDIYSLGTVLYELLTGRPPFRAESTVDTILQVIHHAPAAPRSLQRDVDKQLEAICLRCLQKDPRQRYTTAKELAEDLGRYLEGAPVRARPIGLLTKCWHWLRNVPLVAAIIGRRVPHPTLMHRVVQWFAVALGIVALVWPFLTSTQRPYPSVIRIASGSPGGEYDQFSRDIRDVLARRGSPVTVLQTAGSIANREHLLADEADVGLLQAAAVSPFPDHLAVAAPLYQEPVFFIGPQDVAIEDVTDFNGQDVIVGQLQSGMQQSAHQIVRKLGLSVNAVHAEFQELGEDTALRAIVTSGLENPKLRDVLATHRFKLVPLSSTQILRLAELDVFRPHVIQAGALGKGVPPVDIPTVSTRTVMVVHMAASDQFVQDLLDATVEISRAYGLNLEHDQDDWGMFPLHSAAKGFFQ